MLEEVRLGYARLREDEVTQTPSTVWQWLTNGWDLVPEARRDTVRWTYDHADDPWRVAFTPGMRVTDVTVADEPVVVAGRPTRVDLAEVRAKAAEQAARLFARL
jgi:hypothetical protein